MKVFSFLFCVLTTPAIAYSQTVDSLVLVKCVDSLINVARSLTHQHEFSTAIKVNALAEKIALENFGRESATYGNCCFNRGRTKYIEGDYPEAEKWYLESEVIRKKVLGTEHPDYAWSLNNLAVLYSEIGVFEKAEPLYLQALAIREKVYGKEHLNYLWSLNNLATLYFEMGQYEKAEPLSVEIVRLHETLVGIEDSDYAAFINNLAITYYELGKFEESEPLSLKAKAIWETTIGKAAPAYAQCITNLANLYRDKGDYDKAETFQIEAKALLANSLGNQHPHYAESVFNLMTLYEIQNKYEASQTVLSEYFDLSQSRLVQSARFLSEKELSNYTTAFASKETRFLSFLFSRNAKNEPTGILPVMSYQNVLFRKGFLLTASIRVKQLAKSAAASATQYNVLMSCQHQLAAEYVKPFAEWENVAALEAKADSIEKVLVRTVTGFGEALQQVSWKDVQKHLKPGETAIEFIHFPYYNPKRTDSTIYAALVLKPGANAPQFVPLFEEREIAQLLRNASGGSAGPINAVYSVTSGHKTPSGVKSLFNLIWNPLESFLQGQTTIYCAPSGLLHRLNLNALAAPFMQGEGQVVILGSTRQLVLPDTSIRRNTDAVLIGGVRYASDPKKNATANKGVSYKDRTTSPPFRAPTRGDNWRYLPSSASEVLGILNILHSVGWITKLDTGYYATEEAFRNIGQGEASPRILHIATHGFFFPDPKDFTSTRKKSSDTEPPFRHSEHAMIRSGLLLAGANETWSTGKAPPDREDGILTAYEISQMNLSSTELVVLSACETGLGDIEGNEGVYGLQRAFKIAGAKHLIMSLWQVRDRMTSELMTDFYRQWLVNGMEIPQAFRKAQQNMKRKYPDTPYHWAGFILVE